MSKLFSSVLCVVIFKFISIILAKPVALESDPNVPFLETFINSVAEGNFEEDRILVHSVKNGSSQFHNLPTKKKGSLVFKLKVALPQDKPIIIISGYDDAIRRSKKDDTEQRTYVVLRKKTSSTDQYFINYAYVRNLFTGENSEGSVDIGGKHKRLEFDIWDARGSSSNYDNLFGWSSCSRTFFVSCVGNPYQSSRLDDEEEPDYEIPEEEPPTAEGPPPPPIEGDKPVEMSTVKLSYDFFTDLDDEAEHAWFVGANVIFVTNTKMRVSTTYVSGEAEGGQARRKRQNQQNQQSPDYQNYNNNQNYNNQNNNNQNNNNQNNNNQNNNNQNYNNQNNNMQNGGFAKTSPPRKVTEQEMQQCRDYMRANNVGGKGSGPLDNSQYALNAGVNDIAGVKDDGRLRNGSDGRGRYGDEDNPGDGLLAPVDKLAYNIGDLFGHGAGKASNSPGQQIANGLRNGGGMSYGISEGAADALGQSIGAGKISDDRSHLDGIMDEALPGVVGGTAGLVLDVANIVAKPLGLEPLLGSLGGLTGFLFGGVLGGPGAAVIGPAKLGLDFGKVAFKSLGMGGLIGMKGSSNKGLDTHCLNQILQADGQIQQENARNGNNQNNQAPAGRGFGSGAAHFGKPAPGTSVVDIYKPIGWRGLLSQKVQPFVGIGSCYEPNKTYGSEELKAASTGAEEAIEIFYLETLRTECNDKQQAQLSNLFKEKHLIKSADKTFFLLNPDSPLLKKVKLTNKEVSSLSLAFEMSVYTQLFANKLAEPPAPPLDPEGKPYSLSAQTLHEMALTTLSQAAQIGHVHMIKLVRNQIVTLKTALIKTLQDSQVMTLCRKCLIGERIELDNDIEILATTLQFIMYKFEPVSVNGATNSFAYPNLEAEFKKYYLENISNIKLHIQLYTIFPITGMFG